MSREIPKAMTGIMIAGAALVGGIRPVDASQQNSDAPPPAGRPSSLVDVGDDRSLKIISAELNSASERQSLPDPLISMPFVEIDQPLPEMLTFPEIYPLAEQNQEFGADLNGYFAIMRDSIQGNPSQGREPIAQSDLQIEIGRSPQGDNGVNRMSFLVRQKSNNTAWIFDPRDPESGNVIRISPADNPDLPYVFQYAYVTNEENSITFTEHVGVLTDPATGDIKAYLGTDQNNILKWYVSGATQEMELAGPVPTATPASTETPSTELVSSIQLDPQINVTATNSLRLRGEPDSTTDQNLITTLPVGQSVSLIYLGEFTQDDIDWAVGYGTIGQETEARMVYFSKNRASIQPIDSISSQPANSTETNTSGRYEGTPVQDADAHASDSQRAGVAQMEIVRPIEWRQGPHLLGGAEVVIHPARLLDINQVNETIRNNEPVYFAILTFGINTPNGPAYLRVRANAFFGGPTGTVNIGPDSKNQIALGSDYDLIFTVVPPGGQDITTRIATQLRQMVRRDESETNKQFLLEVVSGTMAINTLTNLVQGAQAGSTVDLTTQPVLFWDAAAY